MKHLYFLLILAGCLFATYSSASNLRPNSEAPLIEHLIEVNELWKDYNLTSDFGQCIAFENDVDRIQQHLELVIKLLSEKQLSGLSVEQLSRRQNHLSVLANYASAKEFPINTGHENRQPYFIDNYGTACAVGYLLLEDEENEFVDRIRSKNNFAYLLDMEYPELAEWATNNGFDVDELALIQPGYQSGPKDVIPVGNNLGVNGKINELLTSFDEELLYMCGSFDEVDGQSGFGNIAAWNGMEWQNLLGGLNGEITDMDLDVAGNLFVVGDFFDPLNMSWNSVAALFLGNSNWVYLNDKTINGKIHTIEALSPDYYYLGGDFTSIGGQDLNYLAVLLGQDFGNYDGAMTVDGPVYVIRDFNNIIHIGGDFSMTHPQGTHPDVQQLSVTNLAGWSANESDWILGVDEPIGVITAMDHLYQTDDIYVGGSIFDESYFSVFSAGVWEHAIQDIIYFDSLSAVYESSGNIQGSLFYDDRTYIYGGFSFLPGSGLSGTGLVDAGPNNYPSGLVYFDKDIRAAAVFQDTLYLAGDFTEVNATTAGPTSVNNLAKTTLSPLISGTFELENSFEVYFTQQSIYISYEYLSDDAVLSLYDISGHLVRQFDLPKGNNQEYFDVNLLPKGAYVYHIEGTNSQQSDLIAIY